MNLPRLYPLQYEPILRAALAEDLGRAGDLTTDAVVDAGATATADLVARAAGTIAGLEVALHAFRLLDPELDLRADVADGEATAAGTVLARISGAARPILAAERTALNLLGRLSGVATTTARYVAAIAGTGAAIVCTRKTTPGLRALEKYAVRCGGGANHRFGLDDAVLVKDNHRVVAGGVAAAVERARRHVGHLVRIEVEVESIAQLDEALAAGADAVLFDNMDPGRLRAAVARVAGRAVTEASGGITLTNARAMAESGVDLLSIGALTHSSAALDVALDFG
jgi:nicotinate-nucleotide pyrophosphorylase (carboxylating)